ncbi:MAG: hypothetical protein MJZ38_05800 [archaeon]|nr:hypothetical protein [archaeon]
METKAILIDASCAICVIIMLALAIYCLIDGGNMYEFNTGVSCAVFCLIPSLMLHLRIMKLPVWIAVIIHLAIFLHAVGVMTYAYDEISFYDIVTHTYSSFVISMCAVLTLMCLQVYNAHIQFTVGVYAIFIVLVMISFGVLWEVFEYMIDQLFVGTHMQYSPLDTIRDMLSNTVGSIMCSAFIAVYMRRRSIDDLIESIELHRYLRRFLGDKSSKKKSSD